MLSKFYLFWHIARWIAILVAIGLICTYWVVELSAHSLEFEYVGPGSEVQRLDHEARDKENERARDRDRNDKPDRSERERECDRERANEWDREHTV
jgi:hypothetical protein